MKKTKLALASLGILLLPVVALAVVDANTPPAVGSITNLAGVITKIQNFMWVLFGGIAVICFIVAGILFLTAGGQPEKIQAARSAFIWGVAGVVIGIIAFSIIAIVSSVIA